MTTLDAITYTIAWITCCGAVGALWGYIWGRFQGHTFDGLFNTIAGLVLGMAAGTGLALAFVLFALVVDLLP